MKKLIVIIILLSTGHSFSQDVIVVNRGDSTNRKKSSDFGDAIDYFFHREEEGKSEAHWAGIDFGFSYLLNDKYNRNFPDSASFFKNNPSSSIIFNLNPFEYKINFGTPHIGLTTGLGFSFRILSIPDNYQLIQPIGGNSLSAELDLLRTYKKNNLFNAYLTVPLMVEINSNADEYESFYFAFGVVGGARIGTNYKRTGVFQGSKFKFKEPYKFGVNSFMVDGVLRMGYKNIGIFTQLGLTPFFQRNKALESYLLSFGLSLNL